MTGKPRYNEKCLFVHCDAWRRQGDVFCGPHYYSLPVHVRNGLWSKDVRVHAAAVRAAINFLQDKRDNALIVKEEGP
jgi:hypothetical protein